MGIKKKTGRIPKPFHWGPKEGISPKRAEAQRKGSRKKKA